jgi:hypothetical protein
MLVRTSAPNDRKWAGRHSKPVALPEQGDLASEMRDIDAGGLTGTG